MTLDLPLAARLSIGITLAGMVAYVTTPIAIRTAQRFAFYDRPGGHKAHGTATPYLGGAAVMLAFALALLVGAGAPSRTLPLILGVAVLWVVGTIDDRWTLSPRLRLLVEFAVGALLVAGGLGWHLGAGAAIDAAATGIWVVAVVNAFNLFDNMDGAASAMALVVAAGACILGLVTGDSWVAAGSAALCGACLGFLPYNLTSPARVFLGDGGSMPLGFAVAALVAAAARKAEPSSLGLLTGFLLVGIPALDTCLVVVSRRRRGVSILVGGQDHLTHRTRVRMRTARRVVLVLGGAQALVSALVIVAGRGSSIALVYILLAFLVCAAATITALEGVATPARIEATTELTEAVRESGSPAPADLAERGRGGDDRLRLVALASLGLGAGISPLFAAYYSTGVWVPIGLVVVLAAAMAAIARPPPLTAPTVLAFTALAGLGLWSLLSSSWATAAEPATIAGNRWLVYAATLLLAIVLLRTRRHGHALLGGIGIGTAIVAVTVLARLLGSDPASLFQLGRLNEPLGYINGEGCVFAMGCWLTLAIAERREPVLAGVGAAATMALLGLTLLTVSRGAAVALLAAAAVALAMIPGRRRRLLLMALLAGAVLVVASTILHVYSTGSAGTAPSTSVVHTAARAIIVAALVVGCAWGLLVAVARSANARGGAAAEGLRRVGTAAAIAAIAIPVLVGLARISSVERTLRSQWHTFVHLDLGPGQTAPTFSTAQARLLSGAGSRYDFWRVGGKVFAAHPIVGVGAGGYTEQYYRERRTLEPIQNPHSLILEVLSELGIVGGLLLTSLVAGVAIGVRRMARAAGPSSATVVAATGMVTTWFVYTSVDWIDLLPGVTMAALGGAAILCRGEGSGRMARGLAARRIPALLAAASVAFVLAVGGASLLRVGLTQVYLDDARSELGTHPSAALESSKRALALDAANIDAYYVKAAALARFNRAAESKATLLAAARQDPASFVTWTLLGDLEVRLRDFRAAKTFYRRALALNPNEPALRTLAADPASASH